MRFTAQVITQHSSKFTEVDKRRYRIISFLEVSQTVLKGFHWKERLYEWIFDKVIIVFN